MVYQINFFGPVHQLSVQNFYMACNDVINKGATKLIIAISSSGGDAVGGLSVYNYLRTLKIPIQTINYGTVASSAVYIYLAADERITLYDAKFAFHEFTTTLNTGEYKANTLYEKYLFLKKEFELYSRIVKSRTNFSEIDNCFGGQEVILSAHKAVDLGIAHTICVPEDLSTEGIEIIQLPTI